MSVTTPIATTEPLVDHVRLRAEHELMDQLRADDMVQWALHIIDELPSGISALRRRLLFDGVRLTPRILPEVHRALEAACEVLGVDEEVEVFVQSGGNVGASICGGQGEPAIITLTSRAIEVFTPAEMQMVIGHELGHLCYGHLAFPSSLILNTNDAAGPILPVETIYQVLEWHRLAEISADRAGLAAVGDLETCVRAHLAIVSGLPSRVFGAELADFEEQIAELVSNPSASDADASHPCGPVRIGALRAFACANWRTGAPPELERAIVDQVSLLGASYLTGSDDHDAHARSILAVAGRLVAMADGELSTAEHRQLDLFLGPGTAPQGQGPDELRAELDALLAADLQLDDRTRRQLVVHLAAIAVADDKLADDETAELRRLAAALGVAPTYLEGAIESMRRPLD